MKVRRLSFTQKKKSLFYIFLEDINKNTFTFKSNNMRIDSRTGLIEKIISHKSQYICHTIKSWESWRT
jgi:hypothetical protein